MITTVTKQGNSLGIQFPKSLWDNMCISENDHVEVWVKNHTIVIKKQDNRSHRTTKERLATFYGDTEMNVDQNQMPEINWGKPQGKEIW